MVEIENSLIAFNTWYTLIIEEMELGYKRIPLEIHRLFMKTI